MKRLAAGFTSAAVLLAAIAISVDARAAAGPVTVYRCPGPPVLYTDSLTAAEAKERNCRVIEGAPISVMPSPRPTAKPAPGPGAGPATRPPEARIDPTEQRSRDSEARRILEAELQREEGHLSELQKEYNNGEPERRGDERNYAKYQERAASLKASIERKEADIAAIKRELAKLPK